MALTDSVVDLVIKARNLLTPGANAAAESLEQLSGEAGELRAKLDEIEDQRGLIKAFQQASTAAAKAQKEWDAAKNKVSELEAEIESSGSATLAQRNQLEEARQAASRAASAYELQARETRELGQALNESGIALDQLSQEQLRLARESRQANSALSSLESQISSTAAQAEQSAGRFRKAGERLKSWTKNAAAASIAGASLAAGYLTRYTAQQAELAQQLRVTSETLGISTQDLQAYQYAFKRVGLDADKTTDIFKDIADKIGDSFQNGGGEAQDAIDALGLSAEELVRLSPDQMLLKMAEAMENLPSASQANILESLSDEAIRLGPLLENNAAQLRALMAEAQQMGVIMTPEEIARLEAAGAAIQRLDGRLQAMGARLSGKLAPSINEVSASIDDALADNPGAIDDLATAIAGLVRTGGEWASSFIRNQKEISESMQTTIDTLQFLGNGFKAAFDVVRGILTGTVAAAAGLSSKIMGLQEEIVTFLGNVGLASDQQVAAAQARAASARQTWTELSNQTIQYGKDAIESGKAAFNAFDNAETAADKAAQAAAKQRAEADAAKAAAKAAEEAQKEAAKKAAEEAALQAKRLENAASSIGTSVEELATGISDSEREVADSFNILATEGELSAAQLVTAFNKAQEKIKSSSGVEYLGKAVDDLVAQGVEGADQLGSHWKSSAALIADEMGTSLKAIRTGISKTEQEAIDSFAKIASTGELSAKELSRVYVQAKEQISSKEGIKAFGAALSELAADGVAGARTLRSQWVAAQSTVAESAAKTSDGAAKASQDTAEAVEQTVTRSAKSIAQLMSNALHETEEQMKSLSNAAYESFAADWGIDTQAEGIEGMQDRIAQLDGEVGELRDNLATRIDSTGFTAWMTDLATTSRETEMAFLEQKIAAERLTDQIEAGSYPAQALSSDMDDLQRRFNLLDESDLSGLEGAISSVRSEVESLSDSVSDTLASLRSELASLQGDSEQVEALRYQQQQLELQQALNQAREIGDAETISKARESLRLAEETHELRLADIRTQSEQEQQDSLDAEAERQRDVQDSEATQRENSREAQNLTSQLTTSIQAQRRVAVDINVSGQNVTLNGVDEDEATTLLNTLSRASRATART